MDAANTTSHAQSTHETDNSVSCVNCPMDPGSDDSVLLLTALHKNEHTACLRKGNASLHALMATESSTARVTHRTVSWMRFVMDSGSDIN